MPNTLRVFISIEWRRFARNVTGDLSVETTRDVESGYSRFGRAVNFNPVASRKQQRFGAPGVSQEIIDPGVAAKALESFDVRVVMTKPDAKKIHGAWVWAVKVIPQRRVRAALKPMTQRAATRLGANQCK